MMKAVSSNRRKVTAVALIYSVLAVRIRLVVLNQRMISKGQKDSGDRAVVNHAVLNRDKISISKIDAVALGARTLEPVDDPVAHGRAKVLDLDQALMPVRRTQRVYENGSGCRGFKSANGQRCSGLSYSAPRVAARLDDDCIARHDRIHRVLYREPGRRLRPRVRVEPRVRDEISIRRRRPGENNTGCN